MQDIMNVQQKKKTILIIDDEEVTARTLMRLIKIQDFLPPNSEVVIAETLVEALDMLTDFDREIIGVITDNGFPVAYQKKQDPVEIEEEKKKNRRGTARPEKVTAAEGEPLETRQDEEWLRYHEGSAAAMLLRFMRAGKVRALSNDSITKLGAFLETIEKLDPDRYAQRLEALKTVPVIWNSGDVYMSKVEMLSTASKGRLIPDEPKYKEENLIPDAYQEIDQHTVCMGKPINTDRLLDYLRDLLHPPMIRRARSRSGLSSLYRRVITRRWNCSGKIMTPK